VIRDPQNLDSYTPASAYSWLRFYERFWNARLDSLEELLAPVGKKKGKNTMTPMLVQMLFAHDLVDELRLMIDPVILGGGKRFFRDDGTCRRLALVTSETTSTGAILATYARSSGIWK
jgi:dihydrofolate reductase